jgi:Reprolysin (M12B) family zinc metalloprotease
MNDTDVFIQPLPERFGTGSHILIEKNIDDSMFEPRDNFLSPEAARELKKTREKRAAHLKFPSSKYFQSSTSKLPNPQSLHIETAIFVDKDLYRHMMKNFPTNTEQHLIRFILAMINGVQLLYQHPSLGYRVNFILKRIEILHNEMSDLRRSSDIDIYLNSFCLWQRKLNPVSDKDILHFDHALILTGLDLYVVAKNGKVSSQVVGLAPVSGMCLVSILLYLK